MQRYQLGGDVGPLEPWPFENPQSEYHIINGSPKASGRIDAGGAGYQTRCGIWACTQGTFSCIEQGDEMMTILSGSGTIIDEATGEAAQFEPGDTLFSQDGKRVTWEITQDVVKVFFGHKPTCF